jgi:hypothetical protein
VVYFNLDKNEVALENFRELYTNYPKSVETDNALEIIMAAKPGKHYLLYRIV